MTGPVIQLASAPSRAASLDPARFGGQKYSSLKPLECLDCITANKGVYNCRGSRSKNWLDFLNILPVDDSNDLQIFQISNMLVQMTYFF